MDILDTVKPRLLTIVLWDDASAPGTSSETHYHSTRSFRRSEQKNDFSSVDRYFWSILGHRDTAVKKKSKSVFFKELVS